MPELVSSLTDEEERVHSSDRFRGVTRRAENSRCKSDILALDLEQWCLYLLLFCPVQLWLTLELLWYAVALCCASSSPAAGKGSFENFCVGADDFLTLILYTHIFSFFPFLPLPTYPLPYSTPTYHPLLLALLVQRKELQ